MTWSCAEGRITESRVVALLARPPQLVWATKTGRHLHAGLYASLADLAALMMAEQKAGHRLADLTLYFADPLTQHGLSLLVALHRANRGPDPAAITAAASPVLARPRAPFIMGVIRANEMQSLVDAAGAAFGAVAAKHRKMPPAKHVRLLVAVETVGVAYLAGHVLHQPEGQGLS